LVPRYRIELYPNGVKTRYAPPHSRG
jgi:hypothetical protein